ncbi:MAG: DUF1684 domain-containing protein [Acetobacteraceae bacterium]|nr:DUF1684 domain-containing protein [Acetobacteraceae bacterium]
MSDLLDLWDWRRRIASLYAAIAAGGDAAEAHRLWRCERSRLFREHPQSPIPAEHRRTYDGPHAFAYDESMRLAVALTPVVQSAGFVVDAGADGAISLTPFARTQGLAASLGGELTLYWIGGYGGGVFLPFGDATNARETYGGGRYLLDTIKGADLGTTTGGRTILDFNFAYFPSCAYSDRFVCPLPRLENRFPAPVRAGERL